MTCCLAAPSHYPNQCWFFISGVLWHLHSECPSYRYHSVLCFWKLYNKIYCHIYQGPMIEMYTHWSSAIYPTIEEYLSSHLGSGIISLWSEPCRCVHPSVRWSVHLSAPQLNNSHSTVNDISCKLYIFSNHWQYPVHFGQAMSNSALFAR